MTALPILGTIVHYRAGIDPDNGCQAAIVLDHGWTIAIGAPGWTAHGYYRELPDAIRLHVFPTRRQSRSPYADTYQRVPECYFVGARHEHGIFNSAQLWGRWHHLDECAWILTSVTTHPPKDETHG